MTVVKGVGRGFRINFVSCTSSQQAADVGILGTFTFASIIPSCSFTFASIIPSCSFTFASIIPSCSITFASIIPSCSFTFARVIPTLFSFFIKTFLLYLLILGKTKDSINDAPALPLRKIVVSDGQCNGGIHTAAGNSSPS